MTLGGRKLPRPSFESRFTMHSCRTGPLAGTLATFETSGDRVECVLQRCHRIVEDPAALHPLFAPFGFRKGVANMTRLQATRLRALMAATETE